MKVAIVHDDFIQHGGAENLVLAILELFPSATLFSTYFTNDWKQAIHRKFPNVKMKSTWMQKLPLMKSFYKLYALLFPVAIESIQLGEFDLVITSSSRYAHGVITKPNAVHIAYIHSPGRMWWNEHAYFNKRNLFISIALHLLRTWDYIASKRPNYIVANSTVVRDRIKKYWRRESIVIYPFHDLEITNDELDLVDQTAKDNYYLIVSRIEKWKNIHIAINACKKLGEKLIIVGTGSYTSVLESQSDSSFVKFVGRVSDAELQKLYSNAKALIMTQCEDFGITSIEAQSFGTPVIAYKKGGSLDTVKNGITGLFFSKQNEESLITAIETFEKMTFDPNQCILNASTFTKDRFKTSLLNLINKHVKHK